ncbi:MAG: haloacid dehalogenase-like hydrolase [Verrucomicrobiota bacterium]|nr:haloacid dehalogenase-like hydrolase [Verrucomicrobiota bacterium]
MTTSNKRLLLWDIDATLIVSGGGGDNALKRAVAELFGTKDDLHDIEIAGRTDRHIARSILSKYGVEPTDAAVAEFLEIYLRWLAELLPQLNGHVLPGVKEILDRLKPNPDRVLALLTGNLRRGAQLKLERYGLWHYFEFGAFADDHHDRNELGAFAQRRAAEKHGHEFEVARIDVIGDTGHDIACGEIFGARTIAVATGSWTRKQLAEKSPDFLFDDLSEVDHVMRTLDW